MTISWPETLESNDLAKRGSVADMPESNECTRRADVLFCSIYRFILSPNISFTSIL